MGKNVDRRNLFSIDLITKKFNVKINSPENRERAIKYANYHERKKAPPMVRVIQTTPILRAWGGQLSLIGTPACRQMSLLQGLICMLNTHSDGGRLGLMRSQWKSNKPATTVNSGEMSS